MVGKTNVPLSLGTKVGSLEVGSIVKMNISGTAWEWILVHQGLPSSMYDESCDGTWVLLKDIYTNRQWDGSNNDYKNSDIHAYLNGDFLNLLDAKIRETVKQVKIPYVNGTAGSPVASGANGLSCKSFLLSGYEVGFSTSVNPAFPRDGAKLDYFSSGAGSAANNKRIANYNGPAANWWLRSPLVSSSGYTWGVYSDGVYGDLRCGASYGVRPALILPSDALIDLENNVIA